MVLRDLEALDVCLRDQFDEIKSELRLRELLGTL